MKKLFLSIILIMAALPIFALELQHDAFLGESKGFDTAVVFSKGKIKNSVGLFIDSHYTKDSDADDLYSDSSNSYTSTHSYFSNKNTVQVTNVGLYYQFTWSPNFVELGKIGIGMDVPLQIGVGYDNYYTINCLIGLNPAFKFEFNKFDLLIGYKGSVLVAEAMYGMPFFKSACSIGVRYSLKKGGSAARSSSKSGISTTPQTEAPDNSSKSKVNVIPGSDIKTIQD